MTKTKSFITMSNNYNNRVLVELSGGTDSAATVLILKQKGYDCVGAMMLLHDEFDNSGDVNAAKHLCEQVNIPFHLIDFRDEFKSSVINYFIDTYKDAKTPNPCILCNIKMKFGKMFEVADRYKCSKIATGHYAQVVKNNKFHLYRAVDENKDQSYVLHFLTQEKLSRLIFPLGNITKDDARKLLKDNNITCINKTESQDICFIKDGNYSKFILKNSDYTPKAGDVLNTKGQKIGSHTGLINYTIGQRKGLGIASTQPLFITKMDSKTNSIVLGTKNETFQNEVKVKNFSWTNSPIQDYPYECSAKLRYRQRQIPCILKSYDCKSKKVKLQFNEGISAVTPGQFAVLYKDNEVLGGGEIYL